MATNRLTTQAHDAQVIAGLKAHLQSVPNLALTGTTFTVDELVALVQTRTDTANTAAAARAHWLDAVADHRAAHDKVTPVLRGLRQYVINTFGQDSPVLTDFGFTPPPAPALTPAQLVARAEKSAATRKARGTLGPKQKKAVHGAASAPAPAATTTTTAVTVTAAPTPKPAG